MSESKNRVSSSTSAPRWLLWIGAVGAVVVSAWYAVLRIAHGGAHMPMADHGDLGSALGPVAALLSLATTLAALWSIELQRRTLAGQQQEIDRHMTLLEEQRAQFARSADAHENLVKSQLDLAEAQQQANKLARNANRRAAAIEQAQRSHTVAVLRSALVAIASASGEPARRAEAYKGEVEEHLNVEARGERQLRDLITQGKAE
ncbi:MAG: hypothetical protein QM756_11160 [Polyangiaceae bacterium]